MSNLIDRQAAIDAISCDITVTGRQNAELVAATIGAFVDRIKALPSAELKIAENLYLYKCYITDEDGLQHEVIHTGDIRRVTGWEI